MKITASGGTDGANIVLFWPDHLPDDGDQRLQDDPVALIEQLQKDGRLIQFPCDSDGSYTLSVFLDEPVPPELLTCCKQHDQRQVTAKGDAYFGGAEYMFKRDDSFRRKYPGMCEKVGIPEGTYAATVYETDVPEEIEKQWVMVHAGPRARRASNAFGALVVAAVLGVLVTLSGLCYMKWAVWFWVTGAMAALVAGAMWLSRAPGTRAVAAARREYEKAYPSYVVHLKSSVPG
jgi:hypothetical protein